MKSSLITVLGFITTLLLAWVLLWYFHGRILANPNDYLMSGSGDGFKNYATTIYHIKHGESFSHYEGMNYPFGEQVVFTDMQPVLANKLRYLKDYLAIEDSAVGWINLSLFFSLIISAGFLCLIFCCLKIPVWYSIPAAIMIAFLSPQVLRFAGHYALAHCFVIPVLFYFLLRFQRHRSFVWALLIGLSTAVFSGLHMYFFAINTFFVVAWLFFDTLRVFNVKRIMDNALAFLLMGILPFVIITVWMGWSDGVIDRPSSPYGFLVYRSMPEGIFLPIDFPLGDWMHNKIHAIRNVPWEGKAYVGLVAVGFFVFLFFFQLSRAVKRKLPIEILPYYSPFLFNTVTAGFALLLFSWGIPFVFGLEWLLDYTGPLQQFRGIGRFAWLFYYAINIAAIFCIYFYAKEKPIPQKVLILLFPLLLGFAEVNAYHERKLYAHDPNNDIQEFAMVKGNRWLSVLTDKDYQAIIPIPYFHVGSENFYIHPNGYPLRETLTAGILTGIPTTGVFMSRTSLQQTMENLQLVLEPYKSLSVLDKMDLERPFAFWVKDVKAIPQEQRDLLQSATKVWEEGKHAIYEMYPNVLLERLKQKHEQVQAEIEGLDLQEQADGYLLNKTAGSYFIEEGSELDFKMKTGRDFYRKVDLNEKLPGQYIVSFWVKLNEDLAPRTEVLIHETVNGKPVSFKGHAIGKSVKVIEGAWGLVEMPIEIKEADSAFELTIYMNQFLKPSIRMRGLLIRPATVDVYRQGDGELMKNLRYY